MTDSKLLWRMPADWLAEANITAFSHWLRRTRHLDFADYEAMRRWSVAHLEDFWAALWEYFDIRSSAPYERVLARREMPGAEWFPGARLNYAEHVFRSRSSSAPALLAASEGRALAAQSWDQLEHDTRALAQWLREQGVGPGDRVAGYLTNCPEAVVALLATASIGAVWAASAPEFGTPSVLDRFRQLEPKVLICVDGYRYGARDYDRRAEVRELLSQLPGVERVLLLPAMYPADPAFVAGSVLWDDVTGRSNPAPLEFAQLPFDHPLWILFSSGTTGIPKAIVHSHGGILLEQMKHSALHFNLKPGQRIFFYTTLGWMMWNFLVSSMLVARCRSCTTAIRTIRTRLRCGGSSMQLKPRCSARVRPSSRCSARAGIVPREHFRLAALESVVLAGSPVSADCMAWFYENVKRELWVMPGSGGTEICSGFVGGVPGPPVYAGEIQGVHLGVDAHAFDEQGRPVIGEIGELVVTQPMPSMPVYLWNDEGGTRYRETYFDTWPGVWRHGDFFMLNDRGGCFVLGRSDATLNRHGIRIGTAEIYRCLEAVAEVRDALIVNLDLSGGRFFMPLFVRLADGAVLDEELDGRIRSSLRRRYSPRHVPDRIYAVDDIPYTLTGKKMEVPVRRLLMGVPLEKAANPSVMRNPEALDYFVRFAAERADYSLT